MLYMYGKNYIKYLNDESAGNLTYEQWKDKILRLQKKESENQTNNQKYKY